MMEPDDERTQLAYAHALAHWGDVGGYDTEVLWDTVTVAALGVAVRPVQVPRAVDAVRRRAEAAGAGGAAARPRRGAAARRAGQLPRRAGQALARGAAAGDAEDRAVRQPRPRAARRGRRPGRHRRGRDGVGARRRVRVLPRGARGQARADGRAAPPLGRGARAAQGARAHPAAAGQDQPGHGLALPRDADPAGEVRGGRPTAGQARGAEGHDAAARRAHRRARGHLRAARADRADASRSTSRSSTASGSACSARTARASRTSCGCSAATPIAHTGVWKLGARVVPGLFAQTHAHPEWVDRTLVDLLWNGEPTTGRRRPRPGDGGAAPLRARAAGRPDASGRCPAASRRGSRSCCSSCPARRCCCSTSRPTTSTCCQRRGAGGGARGLRRHGPRGHARPLVRPVVRPLPGLRRGRRGLRVGRAGLRRDPGCHECADRCNRIARRASVWWAGGCRCLRASEQPSRPTIVAPPSAGGRPSCPPVAASELRSSPSPRRCCSPEQQPPSASTASATPPPSPLRLHAPSREVVYAFHNRAFFDERRPARSRSASPSRSGRTAATTTARSPASGTTARP